MVIMLWSPHQAQIQPRGSDNEVFNADDVVDGGDFVDSDDDDDDDDDDENDDDDSDGDDSDGDDDMVTSQSSYPTAR